MTHEGYLPGTPEYRRVVWSLFAAGLTTFTLLYSTQALLPDFTRDFGVSTGSSTLAVSMAMFGIGLGLLVAGPLSDVVGRTRLIHLSLGTSVAIGFATALAPSWEALLALRFVDGVALSGLPAVATAYLREELHRSSQGRAAGLYVGGTAFGGMSGRLISGFGADLGDSWRWGLVATACVGLGCAVLVRVALPPSRGFEPVAGNPRALAAMSRRALSDPALLALYAIGGCSLGALGALFNTIGFRLAEPPFLLGIGAASLVFLVYPLGTVSATWFGGLADRYGRRAVIPIGAAVAIVGVLLTLPDHLPLIVVGLALLIVGFFAVHGIASGWVPLRAHLGGISAGQAASLYLFTYYLGSSVFGTTAGALWTRAGWVGVVALAVGLLLAVAALAGFLRRTPSLVPDLT